MINENKYWKWYYDRNKTPFTPSPFAHHVIKHYAQENHSLIELGCGNGRDAIYFANKGLNVLAYDLCEEEIEFLSRNYPHPNLEFKVDDFTNLGKSLKCSLVYSRFTIHSISYKGQTAVLNWVSNILLDKGYFLLEARGKQNELFKKGVPVEDEQDAYIYNNHYRRFLDFSETCKTLESIGLKIVEASEKNGFSPINGNDETLIRIVAQNI